MSARPALLLALMALVYHKVHGEAGVSGHGVYLYVSTRGNAYGKPVKIDFAHGQLTVSW